MTRLDGVLEDPIRVLYVNDDDAFSGLVRTRLDDAATDLETVSAGCVQEALATLSASAIDCVVTAYSLPDGTGVELVEAVRDRTPRLPTILFTGQGSEQVASDATRAGVSEYIPVRPGGDGFEALETRIRTLVAATRERRRAARVGERLQRTLDRTTDAVYAVDTEWRIEFMNDRMAERVGRDPETVIGRDLWEEFPSIVGTELETGFRDAMDAGEPVAFEQYVGDPFDYWVRVRAFPDEDGLTVFSRDITDERERRRDLRRNETVLRNVHDAVFVLDEDFDVRFANPAAARALGRDGTTPVEGERLDDLVSERVTPEATRRFSAAVESAFKTAEPEGGTATGLYDADLRVEFDSPSGTRSFDIRLTPIEEPHHRQVLVVARDVTEQRRVQRRLERERDAFRAVQRVIAEGGLTIDERLEQLLETGCETLCLDVGIVSDVEGDEYEVAAVHAPDVDIDDGESFDLASTYCEEVVADRTVRSFANAADADGEITSHPAYREFGLRSYVGVPLFVEDERFGTLNFSSPEPRDRAFGEFEETLVRLLAEWIGTELGRQRERERAETHRDRLRRVIDTVPQQVFVKDIEGTYTLANDAAAEMHGVPVSTLEGATDEEFSFEGDGRDFREDDRTVIETGEPIHVEEDAFVDAHGRERVVQTDIAPLDAPTSQEQEALVVTTDVTERKQRNRKLARYEALVENMDAGAAVVDDDRRLEYVNERIIQVAEAPPEGLLGRPVMQLAHELSDDDETLDTFERTLDSALQGEKPPDNRVELAVELSAGDRVVEYLFSPFRYDGERKAVIVARDVTRRNHREAELERNRDLLRRTQESASVGGWEVDLRTDSLRWTDEVYHIHEVSPDRDVTLEEAISFYHPDDRPTLRNAFDRLQEEGEPYDLELRIITETEEVRWVRARGEPRTEEGETVTGARGVFQDITADKRSEAELERTNRRMESLIDAAPLTIMEIAPDGEVLRWNRGAEEMFGWSREEVVGTLNPVVPEDRRSEFVTHRQRTLDGERIRGKEVQRRTKDAELRDLLLSAAPIAGPDGEVTSVIATLDDITAQKRMETRLRALQETAQRLNVASSVEEIGEVAIEAAAEVLGLDLTGIWRYDGRKDALVPITETTAARDLFGTSPRFTPGDSLAWKAFDTGDVRVYDDVQTTEERYNPETEIRSEIIVPLGDYGVLSTGSTSEREFSEADIDLFRILGATTEAAMVRADREEELRRQNERLDEFAHVVAHDLRNPLTVAMNFLDVAEETGDSAHFEQVESAHDRIQRLIDDLLTLAVGETTVEDGTDLRVSGIAEKAWGYVDTGQATLTVAEDLPTLYGDESRLTQLFENLFRNAVEHGGDDVTITVGRLTDGGGFYVEDDGEGIPPGIREEVFDHGFTTREGGTGFGLSIVADIARAHDWTVSVSEGSEGGARFEFGTAQ
ncbi:MAG: PAS domain-containing protein [Haloarculaceae archaeon]